MRGTLCLSGTAQAYPDSTGISRYCRAIRGITDVSGALPTYRRRDRPIKGTTHLSGAPSIYQEHHRPVRGSIYLMGRRRPTKGGTTDLSEAPLTYQRHRQLIRGTSDLSETSSVYQGHHRPSSGPPTYFGVCVWGGGGLKLLPLAPPVTAMACKNRTLKQCTIETN